jgi:hypothetical protein
VNELIAHKLLQGVPIDTICVRWKQGRRATIPPMNRSTSTASLLSRTRHLMALGLGLFLGQAVVLMAQRDASASLGFAISTVFVAASSASFVLFVLGQQRKPLPTAQLWRQGRGLVAVIGVGLLLSLQAFA